MRAGGYAAQTIEPEFFAHPLRAFLAKPFKDEALQRCVGELLEAASQMRARGDAPNVAVPLVKTPVPR